jgi:hypothetical protein
MDCTIYKTGTDGSLVTYNSTSETGHGPVTNGEPRKIRDATHLFGTPYCVAETEPTGVPLLARSVCDNLSRWAICSSLSPRILPQYEKGVNWHPSHFYKCHLVIRLHILILG